jgi:hypothetical protein
LSLQKKLMKNLKIKILIIIFFLANDALGQLKVYTITKVNIDSFKINLQFDVRLKDSLVYPLDANPDYVNIYRMENNFYNIVLEKLNNNLFKFEIYTLNEGIEYILEEDMYGKKAKTKYFNLIRPISRNPNVIESGIYRAKLTLDLGKYNKGYKKYHSEFIYFKVEF